VTDLNIPVGLVALTSVRGVGCTGVCLRAIRELEKIADDLCLLKDCMAFLRRELGGYATLWQLDRELETDDPRAVLPRFAARLEGDREKAVDTAWQLLDGRAAEFLAAPSSGILKQLTARLAGSPAARDGARIGLAGADAIGPTEILNIVGTRDLARSLPTVVVTTRDRLVPAAVFDGLGSPLFERIPLSLFDAIVVNDEVLTPDEAGRRARHATRVLLGS
jgi:hypothetical protein